MPPSPAVPFPTLSRGIGRLSRSPLVINGENNDDLMDDDDADNFRQLEESQDNNNMFAWVQSSNDETESDADDEIVSVEISPSALRTPYTPLLMDLPMGPDSEYVDADDTYPDDNDDVGVDLGTPPFSSTIPLVKTCNDELEEIEVGNSSHPLYCSLDVNTDAILFTTRHNLVLLSVQELKELAKQPRIITENLIGAFRLPPYLEDFSKSIKGVCVCMRVCLFRLRATLCRSLLLL